MRVSPYSKFKKRSFKDARNICLVLVGAHDTLANQVDSTQNSWIQIYFYHSLARRTEEKTDLGTPMIIRFYHCVKYLQILHTTIWPSRKGQFASCCGIRFPILEYATATQPVHCPSSFRLHQLFAIGYRLHLAS